MLNKPNNSSSICANKLLVWFERNQRVLPWRQPFPNRNAYEVWISEVMLQQTQVSTVIAYFNRWLSAFPTIQKLSSASEDEVLRHWQGLGYYKRARNIKKTAKIVCEKFNGVFPKSAKSLILLPGIGSYTANAIASFASCTPTIVIDANVGRVVARLFGIYFISTTSQFVQEVEKRVAEMHGRIEPFAKNCVAKKTEYRKGRRLVSEKGIDEENFSRRNVTNKDIQSAVLNEALIEFGALQCVAKIPNCSRCSLKKYCVAYLENLVETLPIKKAKAPKKRVSTSVLLLECNNKLLVRKRLQTRSGRMQNLWEFISLEHEEKAMNCEEILIRWIDSVEEATWPNRGKEKKRFEKAYALALSNFTSGLEENKKNSTLQNEIPFPPFSTYYTSFKVEVSGWLTKLDGDMEEKLDELMHFPSFKNYKWVTPLQLERLPMAVQGSRLREWYNSVLQARERENDGALL